MCSAELDNLARIGQLKREPRNLAEYEGHLEHDERLLTDMLAAAGLLLEAIRKLQ